MIPVSRLPDVAQRKLAVIAARAEDLRALAASAGSQVDAALHRLARLRNDQPPLRQPGAEDADDRKRFAAMDRAETEVARLRDALDARNTSYAVTKQLLAQVEEFLVRQPDSASFEAVPAAPVPTGEPLPAAVERLRGEIAEVRRQIGTTRAAPLAVEQAKQRARALVERLAEQGRPRIDLDRGRFEVEWRPPTAATLGGGAFSTAMTAPDLMAKLCWLAPALVEDALLAEFDRLGLRGGLTNAERTGRLTELRDRLRDLERQEEAAICAAADQGQEIQRRSDASPMVVLGLKLVAAQELAA